MKGIAMSEVETNNGASPMRHRQEQIEKYWAGDLSRKVYLLRRQRKAILENCRRIAVVGASADPESASFVTLERLLGLGLEIIPVCPGRESLLGLRCYASLRDVPGKIDIVQVYPREEVDLLQLARDAVERGVATFWIEVGMVASPEVEDILCDGKVQLVQYESLEIEYLKHAPAMAATASAPKRDKKSPRVHERMTRDPTTVTPEEALKDAIWKMEIGHFRHLPVIDNGGKLIGVLSDRDIRLIRPSLAFVDKEDAMTQLWSIAVQQAAVFDPVKVKPDTSLKEAADLMLRWHVGGLPVVDKQEKVIGIITYTDILREFVGREEGR
jgi:predicted CoA-binding protein/CBS domain-containing protein